MYMITTRPYTSDACTCMGWPAICPGVACDMPWGGLRYALGWHAICPGVGCDMPWGGMRCPVVARDAVWWHAMPWSQMLATMSDA